MTLEAYSPDQLDQLALRALDVCARLRGIAETSRAEELATIDLHDKKALEWLGRLEDWLQKTEADLAMQVIKHRGRRRAIGLSGKNAGNRS